MKESKYSDSQIVSTLKEAERSKPRTRCSTVWEVLGVLVETKPPFGLWELYRRLRRLPRLELQASLPGVLPAEAQSKVEPERLRRALQSDVSRGRARQQFVPQPEPSQSLHL